MGGHFGFVNRACIIVKAARYREVDCEVFLRDAEIGKVSCDGLELLKALVKQLVHSLIALKSGNDLGIRAAYGHEVHNVVGLVREHVQLVHKKLANLVWADFIELIDRAHYVSGLFAHAGKAVKSV